jgi:hypothetical protein
MSYCNAHDFSFSVMWECIYNAYWFAVRACACVEINLTEGMLEWADFMLGERHTNVKFIMEHPIAFCVHGMCKVQSTQQFVIEFYVMSGYLSCHVMSCWAYPSITLPKTTLLRGPERVRCVQNC